MSARGRPRQEPDDGMLACLVLRSGHTMCHTCAQSFWAALPWERYCSFACRTPAAVEGDERDERRVER